MPKKGQKKKKKVHSTMQTRANRVTMLVEENVVG